MASKSVIPTGAERSEAQWRDLFVDASTKKVAPIRMTGKMAIYGSSADEGGHLPFYVTVVIIQAP
jgi:hypothetical protein